MMSPALLKLAAWRKWIFFGAILWSIALVFVARGTARFREHQRQAFESQLEIATQGIDDDLERIRQDNSRLQKELKKLPELSAAAAQLKKEFASQGSADSAIWAGQSNMIQAAIEQKQQELAEIHQWSAEWHKAKRYEAAQARMAEKAKAQSRDPEKEYAETKEVLASFALAYKRLSGIRNEWTELDKSEKEQFRPRLEEAQAEWWAAHQKIGKDRALYQDFPVTNSTQDPSTVLLMRSVIPDQNGVAINVFLDGNVTFVRENEKD